MQKALEIEKETFSTRRKGFGSTFFRVLNTLFQVGTIIAAIDEQVHRL